MNEYAKEYVEEAERKREAHLASVMADAGSLADALVPHGHGPVSRDRLLRAMERVARRAFSEGEACALLGLLDTTQAARILGVSPRRVRAKARALRERGIQVGWKLSGGAWVFRDTELDLLARALGDPAIVARRN